MRPTFPVRLARISAQHFGDPLREAPETDLRLDLDRVEERLQFA
jgi:hypothetical protein